MSASQSRVFKGTPYAAPYATPNKLVSFGNTAKLTFAPELETKDLPDYENPGGGVAESFTRIKSAKITLELKRVSVANLALALGGKATVVAAGAVVDEAVEANLGCLCLLGKPQETSAALTVKNAAGTTTYVEGEDYLRKRAGFIPLATGAIVDGAALSVSYTGKAGHSLEALVDLTAEYRVLLDGIDEVSGDSARPDFFRVKFGPAKSIEWIGDDYATLLLEGTLLKDESKIGVGASQYTSVLVGF